MMTFYRVTLAACFLTFIAPGRGLSQDPPELMYIGDSLYALRLAINGTKGFTPVVVKQLLREQIVNPELVVIIVPPPKKAPPDRVRLLKFKDSSPADFDVDAKELDALRQFRTNTLLHSVQAVAEVFAKNQIETPAGKRAVESLVAAIKKEPNSGPFVGGLLAAEGVRHTDLAEYVRDYQASLLDEAKKSIDPKKVKAGSAYYFGPSPVTKAQLAGVSWQNVGTEVIDGEKFQKVWIGGSLVLVKPTDIKELPPLIFLPDGMDGLRLDPTREKEIRLGHVSPGVKLERLPLMK